MSSYTKQMIAAAAEWLTISPDPANPFLRIPGLGKNRSRVVNDMTDEEIAEYERRAAGRPEMKPYLDELKDLTRQIREIEADAREREEVLEQVLNRTLRPGQAKHSTDDRYHAYIGRWCLAWARHGHNVFDLSSDFACSKERPPVMKWTERERYTNVQIGRRAYSCGARQTCVGNLFWDAAEMTETAAMKLVAYLLSNGWSVEQYAEDGPFAALARSAA